MKTLKKNTILFSLMLGIFLLFDNCSKEDMKEDCDILSSDIDSAKDTYASGPNAANCQRVIEAYNKYINNKCDDTESYINLRDAFQKKNCP